MGRRLLLQHPPGERHTPIQAELADLLLHRREGRPLADQQEVQLLPLLRLPRQQPGELDRGSTFGHRHGDHRH